MMFLYGVCTDGVSIRRLNSMRSHRRDSNETDYQY
jgi:hypothetical protein